MEKFDTIVIGLGAMGSASVYQLAKTGQRVLGIEQYESPHSLGSSHGETRITRQAIAEGSEYVPLVRRSNEIWKELEHETGERLFTKTGILIMASNVEQRPNKFVDNTIAAAKEYDIKHKVLTPEQVEGEYPQFLISGAEKAYFEEDAGFLHPEACISVQLELAAKLGATLHQDETFLSYQQHDGYMTVKTNKGEYHTSKLVLAMGPWAQSIFPDELRQKLKVYRQVLYWFEIDGNVKDYAVGTFPVFNWEFNTAHEDFIYGFPSLDGRTVKIATEQYEAATNPSDVDRKVSDSEISAMYEQYVQPCLKGISSKCVRAESCLYTVAPDWRFLIDTHPENNNVIIASPCSGHGFKHSAAIGEVIADIAMDNKPKVDISAFSFARLGR